MAGDSAEYRRRKVRPLACAALLLGLLAGCGEGDSRKLAQWSFSADGWRTAQEVTLPLHLAPAAPGGVRPRELRLRRDVRLPPAWQGRPLTLTFTRLAAPATLLVDGRPMSHRDLDRWSEYRVAGPQSWTITPAEPAGATRRLELILANTWTQSAWLDVVPRLTTAADGEPRYRAIREWNRASALLGLTATFISALIYFALFLFNRQRTDTGWYALEAVMGGLYPALNLNLLQPLVGRFDAPIAAVGVSLAGLAGVHMMHAYLKLGRPHPAWGFAWLAHLVTAAVFRGEFQATQYAASTGGLYLAVAAAYQVIGYARAARRGATPGALTLSVGWLAMICLGGVDILSWLGFGRLFGGWEGAGIGIFMIATAQSINLGREHIVALRRAERLTRELQERVDALEVSNREVRVLNQELRLQVKVRSQDIAEALSRDPGGRGGPPPALDPGDVISDRYRVESVLGSGGMGVVYRAVRLSDDRPCALKVIKHRPSNEHLARLSREAMVLAEIVHPNIIGIYDINVSASGQLYIVMELVEGQSLDRHAANFGDAAWGLPVLRQTAAALQAIHDRNVVHRDLKPANILLADGAGGGPRVKLVDFGLAGLLAADESSMLQLVSTVDALSPTLPPAGVSLTQTGAILGTPLYMAPEFVSGTKEIGAPADVFSFGVIAYEVLGRRRPFKDLPLATALHGRALEPEVPLAELCAGLPLPIAHLLTRCLRANPSERPTAYELVAVLPE